ncbi:hypothetical protein [Flavivirga sp. 57AJ16]|uniref:hypothetical protein n=1 Tax=Flavivirga sp. 57AJ16 TaxID=3025307 RepID=UPI002366560B|nr:hypothetical protein [Flavivirga sp. 57AJ16]MDD7887747.1 hypothetical protein [Flavivirga sp. 57AJ16]
MKKYFLTVIFGLLLLTGCSTDDNNTPQVIITHWNLIKTTGGIAGVNDTFPLKTVIWTFDEVNLKLTIVNNNTDDTKQDALDSGTYAYSVTEKNNKTYINISTNEFGGFETTSNQLVIDQNDLSEGSGADGFVYTFQRTTEVVE